jgi:galactokinase
MAETADPARLAAWFSDCHGRPPELIWRAPGRVNLIGEHTDYNDGLVLPFAIGPGVLAAAAARIDGLLELRSRQVAGEAVLARLDELEPGAVGGWAGYLAGCAWALQKAGCQVPGASVAVDSDLPIGAGLASSAALCCAVVSCLAALAGVSASAAEMARLARSAEADFVGMPCGIMDQMAAMMCHAGHALLLDCQTCGTSDVPVDLATDGLALLVADTGVRHALADGQYAARRAECVLAARLLGVPSLRAVADVAALASIADDTVRRRARHVVTENRRVSEFAWLLQHGRLTECGQLLTQSHASLRDDFSVSWPAADAAVEAALSAGALGARMTGAGFGGSVLVLLPADRRAAVETEISAALAAAAADVCVIRTNSSYESRIRSDGAAFLDVAPSAGASQVWPQC